MVRPGLYVVQGDSTKNLSLTDPSQWINLGGTTNANPDVRTLANDVAWVFIALEERRQQIAQTPHAWLVNNDEQADVPFGLGVMDLQRIDEALQLYGRAYYHKRRTRGRGIDALGWLDPATVEPNINEERDIYTGHQWYIRHSDLGPKDVPVQDLLRFELYRTREMLPGSSAARATKVAAEILRAVDKTAEQVYDNNNGLPIMLVKVPAGTADQERTRLADRFKRLFNSGEGPTTEQKTIGVPEGVEVVPLSLKPSELAMGESTEMRVRAILAAHGVPYEIIFDSANFATIEAKRKQFALKIAYRLRDIAYFIERDEDMRRLGLTLDVNPQAMAVNLDEEERRVNMWSMYVDRGIDPMSAFQLAGVEPPEDLNLVTATEEAAPADEPPPDTPEREEELRALRRFVANGTHLKREFEAKYLEPWEIQAYIQPETVYP